MSKKSKRSSRKTLPLDDDDDDNIYDEVDRFNMEHDFYEPSHKNRPKRPIEVLSINVDESEEDEIDSEFEAEIGKSNDDRTFEEALPSIQKWGKKRHAFYGSYADADYGGVNDSEEEEILELEEEDAISRQKNADADIAIIDYDALDRNLETDSDVEKKKTEKLITDDFSNMSDSEQLEYFLATCPKLEEIIQEYKDRTAFFDLMAKTLINASTKLLCNTKLKDQIVSSVAIYTGYLSNMLFYLKLTCSCAIKNLPETTAHPVMNALQKYKKILKTVDNFTTKVFNKLSHDPDWLIHVSDNLPLQRPKKSYKSEQKVQRNYDVVELEDMYEDAESELEKRGVSYEISKNRGIDAKRKRSKDLRHSRVKKRRQFDKALIRRRSQVPDVKRELTKYDGEKRGIKANTVRSIKLKA